MKEEGKVTPWYSWDEWKHVKKILFSFDNANAQKQGVGMVAMWKSNVRHGTLPISIDLTASLIDVYLQNRYHLNELNYECQRLASSMILVRFINGITDQLQTGEYAQSVQVIAEKLEIPDWLVDLRHESTHSILPGMDVLQKGIMFSLSWLEKNYWNETEKNLYEHQKEIFSKIKSSFEEYTNKMIALTDKETETQKIKKKIPKEKEELLQKITQNVSKLCNPSNIEMIVDLLIHYILIPVSLHSMEKDVANLITETNELDELQIKTFSHIGNLLKPLIAFLNTKFPVFLECLSEKMISFFESEQYRSSRSMLLCIAMLSHMEISKDNPSLIHFLFHHPSTLSFQILDDIIIQKNNFSENFKSLWISFRKVFVKVVDSINNKNQSVQDYKTPENLYLDCKTSEMLTCLKAEYENKVNKEKNVNSKWTLVSDKDLENIPVIGYIKNIPSESQSHLEFLTQSLKNNCDSTKDIVDTLFPEDNIELFEDDTKTEEYRLEVNCPWKTIDFQVRQHQFENEDTSGSYNRVKNIQSADIMWF